MMTLSEIEAAKTDGLTAAGQQVAASASSVADQITSGKQKLADLNDGWGGDASTAATNSLRTTIAEHQTLHDSLQRVQSVLQSDGGQLTSARSAIVQSADQLKSQGWDVADDGTVSAKSGGALDKFAKASSANKLKVQMLATENTADLKKKMAEFVAQDKTLAQKLRGAKQSGGDGGDKDPGSKDGTKNDQDTKKNQQGPITTTDQHGNPWTLNATQTKNAQAIIDECKKQGLTRQQTEVAVMAAVDETNLNNYGNPNVAGSQQLADKDSSGNPYMSSDHLSVGLFQQQNNWGDVNTRMNPTKATDLFINGNGKGGSLGLLETIKQNPSLSSASPWVVAQAVQGSYANNPGPDYGANYKACQPATTAIMNALDPQ